MRKKIVVGFLILSSLSPLSALGKIAPTFRGELLSGGRYALEEHTVRKKGLLICFWATWCAPCLEELRHLKDRLGNADLPVEVVSVNVDNGDSASDVRSVVRQQQIGFPVLLDPRHEIFSQFQLSRTLPFSVLIGPKLEVLETFSGYNESMVERVAQRLHAKGVSREKE